MKRPIALTVVAIFLFAFALSAILTDEVGIGGFSPGSNLVSILNICAAIGLLKLSRGWRNYVLFVFTFSLLLIVPFSFWAVFHPGQIVVRLSGIYIDDRLHEVLPTYLVAIICFGIMAINAWMLHVLMRRDVRELFHRQNNTPKLISI
jgi:hypothetical protein